MPPAASLVLRESRARAPRSLGTPVKSASLGGNCERRSEMLDLVIKGGRIIDGTGAPAYAADVAIADGKIVEVGAVSAPARQVIDADGAVVTPGFIDPHTH